MGFGVGYADYLTRTKRPRASSRDARPDESKKQTNKRNKTMTVGELVKIAGLESNPEIEWFDYAVPMNPDGTYPFDGRAISVMSRRVGFELVPYRSLAQMAHENTKDLGTQIRLQNLIVEIDANGLA